MIRQATAAIPMQEPGLAAPPPTPAREAPGNQSWKSNFLAIKNKTTMNTKRRIKTILPLAAVAVVGFTLTTPSANAEVIDILGGGGGVTASSEITESGTGDGKLKRNPGNLVDGSGLITAEIHDMVTANQWLSSSDGNANWGGLDPDLWVLFDLGAVYTVDSMKVWNFSEGDWSTGRGVNAVSVDYGTTVALGSTVPGITNLTIAPDAVGGGITGTTYNMGGIVAQYIKIDITPGSGIGNHGGDNNFYGMNEVQFDGVPVDSDGDGLPDSWETANGLDPGDPADASSDPDNDNLTNLEEFGLRTDPQENDTDMDGLLDGVESNTGTWNDPNDTGTDPRNPDSDDDGLGDGVENPDLAHNPLDPSQQPGTDPNLADTDGDGKDDGEELADGTDPTNTNDVLVPAGVLIGDGAERPFDTGGSPDGWSGITVLETAIIDSSTLPGAGDLVEILEVSMLADAGRAGGTHHLIPLLVNSANEIAWIGPELTPTQSGHNIFPITGADQIDVSTETYRLGVWQWNEGVNNSAGGTIAFAGSGGGGMFQQDIDGTLGAAGVSIGHVVTTGHSSGAGGRDYQIDVLVGTSEPDVVILTDVSSDSGAGTISFSWESKAGKLYNLRSEADPALIAAVEPLDWPISDGNFDIAATPPENTLTIPIPADLTRLFVIEGFPAPPVSIFSDDFEGGQGGWTTGTEGAVGTMWELGLPGFGPEAANSPTSCFGTNLTALYAEDADVWLRSPPIDLTNTGGATLNYFEWRDIETAFDSGRVVVLDATDNSEIAEIENPIDGFSNGWENVSQQIPPAALGREIKIEFRFQSDDIANFPGWYIDDVLVTIP